MAVLPKNLRAEKQATDDEKAKAEKEKKDYEEKNRAKIRKQEKKKAKKLEVKKEEKKAKEEKESQTLFVRNIGYETDEPKFLEYMKKFGEVKYAVLCKSQVDDGPPHKGTGFVRFKSEASAIQLLELSSQVEGTMDKERCASRLH